MRERAVEMQVTNFRMYANVLQRQPTSQQVIIMVLIITTIRNGDLHDCFSTRRYFNVVYSRAM